MRRSFTDDLGRDLRHFANVVANKGVAAVLTSLLYFKQKYVALAITSLFRFFLGPIRSPLPSKKSTQ